MQPAVPLLQQAWYNGWKKLHGMKYQTVNLPNGMNFDVFGPVSVRHNDLFTLYHSDIDAKLRQLQVNQRQKFSIYGDSAYILYDVDYVKARHNFQNNTPRQILENRVLSSCRQTIEWDYGNLATMWSYLDFKKVLRMRRMKIANAYISGLILRNANNTFYGCNTSLFFKCLPPSFEAWIRDYIILR